MTTADQNSKKKSRKTKSGFFRIFFRRLSVVKNSSNDDETRSFATMKLECSRVLKNFSFDDNSKSIAATKTGVLFHSLHCEKLVK